MMSISPKLRLYMLGKSVLGVKVDLFRWWLSDPGLVGPKQNAEWWRTFGQVEGFWDT